MRTTKEQRKLVIALSISGGFSAGTIAKAIYGRDTQRNRGRVYSLLHYWKAGASLFRSAKTLQAKALLNAILEAEGRSSRYKDRKQNRKKKRGRQRAA